MVSWLKIEVHEKGFIGYVLGEEKEGEREEGREGGTS